MLLLHFFLIFMHLMCKMQSLIWAAGLVSICVVFIHPASVLCRAANLLRATTMTPGAVARRCVMQPKPVKVNRSLAGNTHTRTHTYTHPLLKLQWVSSCIQLLAGWRGALHLTCSQRGFSIPPGLLGDVSHHDNSQTPRCWCNYPHESCVGGGGGGGDAGGSRGKGVCTCE